MKLYIYKIDQILFEGETETVTLPAESGEISVLDGHIPLITHLVAGKIKIKDRTEFQIAGGFAEIGPYKTILLVN